MLVETRRCGRLFVDVRGEGPTIVLWHSFLCSGAMWGSLPDDLARTHRVINIDGPGHGRSSPLRADSSLDDHVEAALEVLDACGARRVVWCGLSWGGFVGMRLALRAPERVSGLVLLDTNADREVPDKLKQYRVLAFLTRVLGPIPPLLDRIEPIYFSEGARKNDRKIVDAFRRGVAAMDRESIQRTVRSVILGRDDIRDQLSRITAPTLVMVGENDIATPRQRADDIVSRIPGARLVTLRGAGHLSAWEQPDAVREGIEGFLATLAPRGAQRATG